jgi:hypothetical protein
VQQVHAEELVEDCGVGDSLTRDEGLKFALNDAASRMQHVKGKTAAVATTVVITGSPKPFPGDKQAQHALETQGAALQKIGFVMVCPTAAEKGTFTDDGFWARFQRLPEGADAKGLSLSALSLASLELGLKERWPVSQVVRGQPILLRLTRSLALPLRVRFCFWMLEHGNCCSTAEIRSLNVSRSTSCV